MAKKEKAPVGKAKGTKMSEEERKAKKVARLEAMKSRPSVQRPNSKQVDVIADEFDKAGLPKGAHIKAFAHVIRKAGVLVTTVAYDAKGEVISVSTAFVPGVKAKSKKGHGLFQPGVAGVGKGAKDDDDDNEPEEDEAPAEAPKKKGKKND